MYLIDIHSAITVAEVQAVEVRNWITETTHHSSLNDKEVVTNISNELIVSDVN